MRCRQPRVLQPLLRSAAAACHAGKGRRPLRPLASVLRGETRRLRSRLALSMASVAWSQPRPHALALRVHSCLRGSMLRGQARAKARSVHCVAWRGVAWHAVASRGMRTAPCFRARLRLRPMLRLRHRASTRRMALTAGLGCAALGGPPLPRAALRRHGLGQARGLCDGEQGPLVVRRLRQLQDDDVQRARQPMVRLKGIQVLRREVKGCDDGAPAEGVVIGVDIGG